MAWHGGILRGARGARDAVRCDCVVCVLSDLPKKIIPFNKKHCTVRTRTVLDVKKNNAVWCNFNASVIP